ncbi:hypothetical protein PHSC3_000927 [Chlamydiales bacterium STE3]|nr:hypothetical protein PHSC3_000927 [Chlamydiales bacterium STE3]
MIVLKNRSSDGQLLEASFLPEQGMNMVSYKKGNIEVIDQSTRDLFEERFSGLGPLIGPHFHRRHPQSLPVIENEALFPHISRIKAKGIQDPFSHGIARYAPWVSEVTESSIKGTLTGKDLWNGVSLADLEGQNFKMTFQAELLPEGLKMYISIVSDTNSLVGCHYFYRLPQGENKVIAPVRDFYMDKEEKKTIPQEWLNEAKQLNFPLDQKADYTFFSFPQPLRSTIVLATNDYRLTTTYECDSQENCWQLYHPEGASFVCIEPMSAQFPRHPILSVSSLTVLLSID